MKLDKERCCLQISFAKTIKLVGKLKNKGTVKDMKAETRSSNSLKRANYSAIFLG